jgi:anaerobic magnesium-protoporphyrin IX monomethyl ester cyclase
MGRRAGAVSIRVALFRQSGGRLQRHRGGTGHLGLGYIAASLLEHGHEVQVLDAQSEQITEEDMRVRLREFRPHIFGVTAMTHEIHAAAHACEAAKAVSGDIVTVVGGPHASALPERTLQEFPSIDVAAVGEGEKMMCELAEAVSAGNGTERMGDILGIAFRNGGQVIRTGNRPWLEKPDTLPFPAWHLFPKVFWPVFASRGCPFGCVFCQRVMGGRVRLRSVGNVLAELDALEERVDQRSAWFQDETFGVNRRWMEEFLDEMNARNRRKGYVYIWGGNSRVSLADAQLYRRMKDSGCYALSFGVESGNDEILKRIKKGITRAMALEAIAAAKSSGIQTAAFFIIGHPGESWRTALQTVHLAAKCRADSIAVGVMVPYPGTAIWEMARAGEYGYRLLSEDWRLYDKYFGNALAIRGLTHRQLEFLQALAYIWYYIYNLRVRKLVKFVVRFRAEAVAMARRVLRLAPKLSGVSR